MLIKLSLTVLALFVFFLQGCSDENDPLANPPGPVDPDPDTSLTDEQLLDLVQKETFKYFWDYAEPKSGAARERYHPDNPSLNRHVVATGGTG